MRNEVAVRNGRDIKNTQNENYTVEEIAEKIVEDHNYLVQLSEGVLQVVKDNSKYYKFHIDYSSKVKVYKGQKLGAYRDGDYDKIDVKATHDGFFKPDLSHFRYRNIGITYFEDKCDLVIGKIFFPEYDFFRDNERKIDNAVKKLKESKQQALELEEQSKRDKEQRENEKLLTDQRKSIENLDNLLKELDKYIEKKELPEIQTLKVINDQLKILYAQKDNLNDVKSIKDNKSHFENAYKEAKKNPELTDIIEQRMLDILKTFYEVLGESKDSINIKISEIKSAGNDKKFAVEFNEKLNALNESITKLQSSFTNEKKLDFAQLETIEKISVDFEKQKKRINQKKLLERSKDSIESIFVEYIKLETKDGSAEKLLKRILKNFYLIFEKSEQQINESFEKIKEKESERKFEIEFTELLNKIGDSITQILNSIETKSSIDFTHLQIIENSLSTLKSKKKEIKNLKMVEDNKSKFESIFDDCRKQNLLSQNSEKSMLEILNKFYDILDFSDEQKKKIQEARQKADKIREFENKVSEQNEAIKSLSEKIRELEVIVENNEPVKIELLQTMEDSITQLAKQKDIIHDKTEIENMKVHFDAIFKDCKKRKDFSNSASLRMQEIEKSFDDILEKKKGFWSRIFGK